MRLISAISFAVCLASAYNSAAQTLPADDAVRLREFYRLSPQIEDGLWPGWSKVPDPVLLVTADTEFLTHFPRTPDKFVAASDGFLARPRTFNTHFQATLPLFGPPSTILIGEPKNTQSKSSTPWLIVLMHEHFHQLQYAQPGYWDAVNGLGLAHGDTTGMWMLNYAFPYAKPEVTASFAALRDQLLVAVRAPDGPQFKAAAKRYLDLRNSFLAQLSPDDRKYLNFQLWQEGIARYMQIKAAEAAASYQPTAEYKALADYEAFDVYARHARADTLDELQKIDIAKAERVAVYSFGATEGLLLDRLHPQWKAAYFTHMLSTESLFDGL